MSSSPRVALARRAVCGRGSNVFQQRLQHRNEFVSRLKNLRIQELNKYRNISVDNLDFASLLDIKKLLGRPNPKDLATQPEIDEVVKEIETLLHLEELVRDNDEEVNMMAESLLDKCQVCDKIVSEGVVCNSCCNQYFFSQF